MPPFITDNEHQHYTKSSYHFFPKDPRVGIAAFVLLIAAAFIIKCPEGMACILFYVILLHSVSGASPGRIWNYSKRIILFALLAVLLNAVLVKGEPLLIVGERQVVSREGLSRGAYYFIQILVLYFSTVLFISLTSQEDIARGISAFLKPIAPRFAERVALYAFLAIGFLPLFFEEFKRIATVQKFRGGGLEGGLIKNLTGVRLLLVPLILSAIHRSGQLAMVVEIRGLKESAGELVSIGRPALKDFIFIIVTLFVVGFATTVLAGVFHR